MREREGVIKGELQIESTERGKEGGRLTNERQRRERRQEVTESGEKGSEGRWREVERVVRKKEMGNEIKKKKRERAGE